MEQPVTIVQIAKESGVSIATVSRVMNGTAPVSEQTRRRVNEVIQRHRYTPKRLCPQPDQPAKHDHRHHHAGHFQPLFLGHVQRVQAAAHEANYSVFLCNTSFSAARIADKTPGIGIFSNDAGQKRSTGC